MHPVQQHGSDFDGQSDSEQDTDFKKHGPKNDRKQGRAGDPLKRPVPF